MLDNRIQELIEAGVAANPDAFSGNAKKVIDKLSDEEFNSLLVIRREILSVVGKAGQDVYDLCLTFIF